MLQRATLFYKEKSDDESENSDWVSFKIIFNLFSWQLN
jgi:hypothetical protein